MQPIKVDIPAEDHDLPPKDIFGNNPRARRSRYQHGYGPTVCTERSHRTYFVGCDGLRGIPQEDVRVRCLTILLSIENEALILEHTAT